ncbi:MAG: putative DNA-binding protein [Syntrophomonadaceae bacterium]|nr:putative DNA-binding protein [Syntrophomonadaceae bacterium]
MLEKIEHIILLFDFYGPLLTEKQQRVMNMHYENDLSLTEIAEYLNISRQAVYDLLKRAVALLEAYEARLQLAEKFSRTQQELQLVYSLLNKKDELNSKDIAKAVKIISKTLESV